MPVAFEVRSVLPSSGSSLAGFQASFSPPLQHGACTSFCLGVVLSECLTPSLNCWILAGSDRF